MPSRPWTRSSGLATIAAMLLFTPQPKFDIVAFSRLGCDGTDQFGQFGTEARVRLTITRTEPGAMSPVVTGAPLLTSMP